MNKLAEELEVILATQDLLRFETCNKALVAPDLVW